jgi:uncharacterized membrane protein YcfT
VGGPNTIRPFEKDFRVNTPTAGRVDWVDCAKGICIILVVMTLATLGVEAEAGREGWLHAVVDFAKPFLMPGFFLISGLFLARVIDRDWRDYLDRKVLHFAYFYVLWVTIQFAPKAPGMVATSGWGAATLAYLGAFIEPFGTLWFIYLLPIFFVVTKLARGLSPLIVWIVAAMLEIAHVQTGWTVADEFANRFVYFYTGYILAPHIFELAEVLREHPRGTTIALAIWGLVSGLLVHAGVGGLPFLSLVLGFAGVTAIVASSALMTRSDLFKPIRYCGRRSIVIYLGFFLPVAVTLAKLPPLLAKAGITLDPGTQALMAAIGGVVGTLLLYWAVRRTVLRVLFERPAPFRLRPAQKPALQPAE